MMGLGGSGSSNDTDDGDDDDEGIPPEQTTIGDQSVDEGSSDDNSSGAGAAGEAAGAAVGGGGGASGGGGAAVGGAVATGGGAAAGGSSSGETKDPEETEEENGGEESEEDETNDPERPEPETDPEPPEQEPPERQEEDEEQKEADEEEEEDDDQEPQEAELVVYTDAWDATGWGIEPVLKKLEQDFGLSFDLSYEPFTPRELDSNDWGDVSSRYDMPYAQVVELPDNTKLSTSALHVAQELDPDLFRDYLRRLRIAALAEGRNIEDRELLVELAGEVGFDTYEFEESWYGDIDDIGEFETMPIMQATVGDHEIPWSGHLEYGLAYGVLLDNDVLPIGDPSTYDQLVGEYAPITTTEIAGITGDDREQIEAELEEREDVVRVEYGDAGFWDQV